MKGEESMNAMNSPKFFICPREILQLEARRTTKLIYMVLCSIRDNEVSNPSYKKLSRICHLHKSTIRQSIRELEQLGVVKRKPCFAPDGTQLSNQYLIRGFGDAMRSEKVAAIRLIASVVEDLLERQCR